VRNFFFRIYSNYLDGSISVPGYLLLKYLEDFVFDDNAIGKGTTAKICNGSLRNSNLIAKHGLTQVAIKVSNDNSQQYLESFEYEVALLAALQNVSNVAQIVGYCEAPKAIVMKWYRTNLRTMLFGTAFECTPLLAYKIAFDIATGMRNLHKRGILHLDLKPGNTCYVSKHCNLTLSNC
jgi:serine/threonine protein kinase